MERKVLFSGNEEKSVVLPPEKERELRASMRKMQHQRELRKRETSRRRNMAIRFETAERCGCGAVIEARSKKDFVETGPFVAGGRQSGYWQEDRLFACSGCGLVYFAGHERFKEAIAQMMKMREPPGEDWVPPAERPSPG